jgi:hypothetical protein
MSLSSKTTIVKYLSTVLVPHQNVYNHLRSHFNDRINGLLMIWLQTLKKLLKTDSTSSRLPYVLGNATDIHFISLSACEGELLTNWAL